MCMSGRYRHSLAADTYHMRKLLNDSGIKGEPVVNAQPMLIQANSCPTLKDIFVHFNLGFR